LLNYLKDIFKFKDLIINLTTKELKLKYKSSVVGFLWSFLHPLMMIIIYSLAFKIILKIPIENFAVFVFIGLLPWTFIQSSLSQCTTSIINNQNLVKKVYFPRVIIPLSVILSNFVTLLINFIILFGALFFYKIELNYSLIMLPVILIMTLLMVIGLSVFLSSLTVKFRDMSHLVDVIFMAWFYLTPIIYSSAMVPEPYKSYILANPMTGIIELYREVLLHGRIPLISDLLLPLAYSVVVFILGMWFFYKRENKLAEEL